MTILRINFSCLFVADFTLLSHINLILHHTKPTWALLNKSSFKYFLTCFDNGFLIIEVPEVCGGFPWGVIVISSDTFKEATFDEFVAWPACPLFPFLFTLKLTRTIKRPQGDKVVKLPIGQLITYEQYKRGSQTAYIGQTLQYTQYTCKTSGQALKFYDGLWTHGLEVSIDTPRNQEQN